MLGFEGTVLGEGPASTADSTDIGEDDLTTTEVHQKLGTLTFPDAQESQFSFAVENTA